MSPHSIELAKQAHSEFLQTGTITVICQDVISIQQFL
jgi:hypothetical protein